MNKSMKTVIIVGITACLLIGLTSFAKPPDHALRGKPQKYLEVKTKKEKPDKPDKTRAYVEGQFNLDDFVPVAFPQSTKADGTQKTWREYTLWYCLETTCILAVGWRDEHKNREFPPDAGEEALWSQYFGALISDEEGKAKIKNTYLKDVKP